MTKTPPHAIEERSSYDGGDETESTDHHSDDVENVVLFHNQEVDVFISCCVASL